MLDRFVRLCEIASPTGEEREVADAVLDELRELGIDVAEDASATPAQAAAGNLIARVPGTGDDWLSFFSHLDTVPHVPGTRAIRLPAAACAGVTEASSATSMPSSRSSSRTASATSRSSPVGLAISQSRTKRSSMR